MSKTIEDLRDALFAALDGLADKKHPMDLDRAKAISEVAQTIINSAKVEVDMAKVSGNSQSKFLENTKKVAPLPAGINSVTVHRMAG